MLVYFINQITVFILVALNINFLTINSKPDIRRFSLIVNSIFTILNASSYEDRTYTNLYSFKLQLKSKPFSTY